MIRVNVSPYNLFALNALRLWAIYNKIEPDNYKLSWVDQHSTIVRRTEIKDVEEYFFGVFGTSENIDYSKPNVSKILNFAKYTISPFLSLEDLSKQTFNYRELGTALIKCPDLKTLLELLNSSLDNQGLIDVKVLLELLMIAPDRTNAT